MIYLASFVIFILFITALAIGLILKKKGLVSEHEAHSILEGLTCASCTCSCGFAGTNHKRDPSRCKAELSIEHKTV